MGSKIYINIHIICFSSGKCGKCGNPYKYEKEDITKHKRKFVAAKYYPSSDCSFYEYFRNFHTFMNTVRFLGVLVFYSKNLHSLILRKCCSLILHLTIAFLKLSFIISAKRLLGF